MHRPIGRKTYHKSSVETIRETLKVEADEATSKPQNTSGHGSMVDENTWVPHERNGFYYPKGHEKVMEDVPRPKPDHEEVSVNWFSYKDGV